MKKIQAVHYDNKFKLEQKYRIMNIDDIVQNSEQNIAWVNAKNSKGETPLHIAAKNRKYKLFETMLPYVQDIEVCDNLGNSILHALLTFHIETQELKKLTKLVHDVISRGADPNKENLSGITPIQLAIMHCNTDILDTFKAAKIDINLRSNISKTLLVLAYKSIASQSNFAEINTIDYLIKSGCDLNSRDEKGNTILHYAVQSCNYKMVTELIKRGADLNIKNDEGSSILNCAVKSQSKKIVKELIKHGADLNVNDNKGYSILHCAVKFCSDKMVKVLVKHGAEVNSKSSNDKLTPLHLATQEDSDTKAKILIEAGAKINAKNANCQTPLDMAVVSNSTKTIQCLIDYGVNVNRVEVFAPLHMAIFENCEVSFMYLINIEGIDLNIKSEHGLTPLHVASAFGNFNFVKALIDRKAYFNATDKNGYTPLHIAICYSRGSNCSMYYKADHVIDKLLKSKHKFNHHEDIVDFLIKSGSNVNALTERYETPLYLAVDAGNEKLVEMLIERKAVVNCVEKTFKETPLHRALINRCEHIALTLIFAGANVNALTIYGNSPLHYASRTLVVKLLLERRAKVNCVDSNLGLTPLHNACYYYCEKGVAKALIEAGADVNALTKNGISPLHMAVQANKLEILELLIDRGAILNCTKSRCRYRLLYMISQIGRIKDIKMSDLNLRGTWLQSMILELNEEKIIKTLFYLCALVNLCEKNRCMPVHEIKSSSYRNFNCELFSHAIKAFGVDDVDDFYAFTKFDCHSTTFKIENRIHQLKFRHLQRKRILALPVDKSHSNHTDKNAIFSYFVNSNVVSHDPEHINEVEQMKNYFIKGRVSLYELLHMNRKDRCSYVKTMNPREISLLLSKFPIYYEMILACFNDAILRGPLIKVAQIALSRVVTYVELPILCSEEICKNLSVINLIAVIQAAEVLDEN